MPSCSTSSNISSAVNSLNITQGSGGSRLIVSIPRVVGLTLGNVIRYDVATSGYTLAKADSPEKSEVFGIVESYTPSVDKLNVVLNGSIVIDAGNLATIADDPTGAAGGNDIYFLSGMTAGVLQNLAPTSLGQIVKPVYQRAPHGTYTGTVVNYSGYQMGGDIQASLDSSNLTNRVGNLQLTFDNIEVAETSLREQRLMQLFMTADPATGLTPLLNLDPTIAKIWNLEFIRIDQFGGHCWLRPIDFPEFFGISENNTTPIALSFQYGWIERLKVDASQTFNGGSALGKTVYQFNHGFHNDTISSPENICYGRVKAWDAANNFLYIERFPAQTLYRITPPALQLFETSTSLPSGGFISIETTTPNVYQEVYVTTTNKSHQLAAVKTQVVDWNTEFITNPGISTGFFNILNSDGIVDPVNAAWDGTTYTPYGRNPVPYLKIKNKGISVNIPQTITVSNVTTSNVQLPSFDIIAKIAEIEARLANGNL